MLLILSPFYTVITENVDICLTNRSESIISVPSCVRIPPLNGLQTLILALPFTLIDNITQQDLLCPVHPLPGERCVDLLSCHRFRESAYANSITICRITNDYDDLNMEMCLHNITEIINETKVHFFYSDLHLIQQCRVPESTRTYTSAFQLIISCKSVLNGHDQPGHLLLLLL